MQRIHKLLLGALCVLSPVLLAACYGPQYYPQDTAAPDTKEDTNPTPKQDVTAQDLLAPETAEEAPQE